MLAALAASATLVLALAGCGTRVVTVPSGDEGVQPLGTVTIRGTGEVATAPDQAEMSFGVETQDEDAREALEAAARVAEDIVDAVKDEGVDDEDVQTTNVSLRPEMDYREGRAPRIVGYRASIRVAVTVTDIESVGDVIGAATDAGSNSLSGPTFTLSDDSPERTAALERAVENARARAEAAAEAAGKSLGDVLSLAEQGVEAPPIAYRVEAAVAADEAFSVPIEPGQVDLSASVTVVFELK